MGSVFGIRGELESALTEGENQFLIALSSRADAVAASGRDLTMRVRLSRTLTGAISLHGLRTCLKTAHSHLPMSGARMLGTPENIAAKTILTSR